MTVRQSIIDILSSSPKPMSASAVHDYMQSAGYSRKDSRARLSKMVESGEVLRCEGFYRLARYIKPSGINLIFEQCRKNSAIYQLDQRLREVRQ
ncbi:hypothetical protein WB66_11000 [bacteria symbiont BFo1 of Frankliniella occidentalis]|nr:hypothetical protein AI28_08125 [bacteria symbiont BFo1 of Frankliniella occidentalis]KYP84737.1 hypothetical protein WB66_11000 [bacteria symbiont BFo1 of Frankliniella occidentalis]